MARASTPCAKPGCPDLTSGSQYCPEHTLKVNNWHTSGRVKPVGWNKVRAKVLRRDHKRCRLCGRPGSTVDHLTPIAWGGDERLTNLRVLCRTCAAAKLNDEKRLGKLFKRKPELRKNLMGGFIEAWRH